MTSCLIVESGRNLQIMSVPVVLVVCECVCSIKILVINDFPVWVWVVCCHSLHLSRVFGVFYIHFTIVVTEISFLVTEICLNLQVLMDLEYEVEFCGHFLSAVVPSGASLLHHCNPSVRRKVCWWICQWSICHWCPVRVHRNETGKTVHSRASPVCWFAIHTWKGITAAEHASCILDFKPRAYVNGNVWADIEGLVSVITKFLNSFLWVISPADQVGHLVASSWNADVVISRRSAKII